MSIMTTAVADHQTDRTGLCPSWCAHEPHRSFGEIHSAETRSVPAASTEHFCGYTTGPDAEGASCAATIDATLSAYDGRSWISISHGGDYLPATTVDGAEQLARHILALVAAARTA